MCPTPGNTNIGNAYWHYIVSCFFNIILTKGFYSFTSCCFASSFLKGGGGTSLAVQWLILWGFNAETQVWSLVGELRSCMPHSSAKKNYKKQRETRKHCSSFTLLSVIHPEWILQSKEKEKGFRPNRKSELSCTPTFLTAQTKHPDYWPFLLFILVIWAHRAKTQLKARLG